MPGQKGNSGGRKGRSGRKSKAEELGLQALLDGCVTEADRKALFRKLLAQGKKGDVKASALLLGYIYGKPKELHEHSGPDGGPIETKVILPKVNADS